MSNENFEWVTISKIEFFRSSEGGTRPAKQVMVQSRCSAIDVDCEAVIEGIATDSDGRIDFNFSVEDDVVHPQWRKASWSPLMREHWLRLQKEMPAIEKTNNQPTDKE
jgi:hypothetical protein